MAGSKTIRYKETLRPPLQTLFFIYFLLGSLVVAIWAALPPLVTQIAFALSIIFLVAASYTLTSHITLKDGQLCVGRARIEIRYIADVIVLDKKEMSLERTLRIDPAAHLALKFWEPKGVKIILNDARDSTPYWLVTTKRGKELAAAISQSS